VQFSRKNTIIIVVLIMTAAAAGYGYKEYNRKPADVAGITPAAKLSADEMVNQYDSDEAKANKLYLGKTIQVTGVITQIINQQDTLANVMVGDTSSMHKVSCLLEPAYISTIKQYNAGQQITIKGVCTGYLMDVELNRCVIVKDGQQ
jgi:phospholipid N-methyltransferase